ncbi:MAG: flavodoxin-dependent (E)-4-hydroxy-3-methylbut-2-enyl-diphosphate synthase [Oscillospiraceae bacterium]|nr:flavodoxin-dependent (E)-4-hydroxy-3-methylbut-2-enyl-diphosphate synthase [Oscillospiraceae bacterium]
MDKRIVKVGDLNFGGGEIFVQSMLSLPVDDIEGNVLQAVRLAEAGCDVIRLAIPTIADVRLLPALKQAVQAPIVADIHFDYKIAVESVIAGADKIRINPGNIGDADRVKAVVTACKNAGIPIRVGVNSGSLKGGSIAESAIENVRLLERFDFNDIVVSVKSSSVTATIAAYRELFGRIPYPLHLGVTEAGTYKKGVIKSAIGIGALLCDGIGDTIRVSLSADPVFEVETAIDILKAVGKRKGVEIISCPTCGRCKIDVVSLAEKAEQIVQGIDKPLKIAVMGCAVNGPGECKDADFGITGGDGVGLIFKKGAIVRKVEESGLLLELMEILEEERARVKE